MKEASRTRRVQTVGYMYIMPGDFVRIRVFKPKRLKPNYSHKDGPLLVFNNTLPHTNTTSFFITHTYSPQNRKAQTTAATPRAAPCSALTPDDAAGTTAVLLVL